MDAIESVIISAKRRRATLSRSELEAESLQFEQLARAVSYSDDEEEEEVEEAKDPRMVHSCNGLTKDKSGSPNKVSPLSSSCNDAGKKEKKKPKAVNIVEMDGRKTETSNDDFKEAMAAPLIEKLTVNGDEVPRDSVLFQLSDSEGEDE